MAASAITARAITQSGPWGPVYGPVDLDIPEGGLNVLVGPAGSGRTALLMGASTLISGQLYDLGGAIGYWAMAAMAGAGGLLALLLIPTKPRVSAATPR